MGDFTSLPQASEAAIRAGVRFGDGSVHTSRTIMLAELGDLLAAVPASAGRAEYTHAIVADNVLHKSTESNRRSTNQRLGEFYALDPLVPIFRALRDLWVLDDAGRPALAALCALARDPLFRLSGVHVLALPIGAELIRSEFLEALQDQVEGRLNDSVLDKVARNAGSSWTQSGHLSGRMRKIRVAVQPALGPVVFATWLGSLEGKVGDELLRSFWMGVFDAPRHAIIDALMQAKRRGVIGASIVGDVVEIDLAPFRRRLGLS